MLKLTSQPTEGTSGAYFLRIMSTGRRPFQWCQPRLEPEQLVKLATCSPVTLTPMSSQLQITNLIISTPRCRLIEKWRFFLKIGPGRELVARVAEQPRDIEVWINHLRVEHEIARKLTNFPKIFQKFRISANQSPARAGAKFKIQPRYFD